MGKLGVPLGPEGPLAMRHWIVLLLVAFAPSAYAADFVVGPPGSGAPYSQIQTAVNVAPPGSRVIVLPGHYLGGIVIDKAIEVWGPGSELTFVAGTAWGIGWGPALIIRDLAPGERVRVSGIGFTQKAKIQTYSYLVGVLECAGAVELNDVKFSIQGDWSPPAVYGGAEGAMILIRNSQRVVCTDFGWRKIPPALFQFPGTATALSGAIVRDSSVWFDRALVVGNASSQGGQGLTAIGSNVTLSRSHVEGGRSGGPAVGVAGTAGAGIVASSNSTVRVIGGTNNVVRGGQATDSTGWIVALAEAGPGIVVDSTSAVVVAADAVVEGGAGEGQFPAAAAYEVHPASVLEILDRRLPSIAFEPSVAQIGSAPLRQVQGEPGSIQLQALSNAMTGPLPLGGVGGALMLDLSPGTMFKAWVLGAGGELSDPIPIPPHASLLGMSLAGQLLQATPTHYDFSTPTLVAIKL